MQAPIMPPVNPLRPPFVPATERQEAFLAELDGLLADCQAEIDRLRKEKARDQRVPAAAGV